MIISRRNPHTTSPPCAPHWIGSDVASKSRCPAQCTYLRSRADGSDVGYLWIVVGTEFSQRQRQAKTAWECDGCRDEAPGR
ncbi:hypothetical protein XFF6992_270060 [Xanthomonas citri pv. fuscans]|nr:hypothetical protein XFF6992_270060 [Xanthomonas citri pv. fuscans]